MLTIPQELGGEAELEKLLLKRGKSFLERRPTSTRSQLLQDAKATEACPKTPTYLDNLSFFFFDTSHVYHLTPSCQAIMSRRSCPPKQRNQPPNDKRLCKMCSNEITLNLSLEKPKQKKQTKQPKTTEQTEQQEQSKPLKQTEQPKRLEPLQPAERAVQAERAGYTKQPQQSTLMAGTSSTLYYFIERSSVFHSHLDCEGLSTRSKSFLQSNAAPPQGRRLCQFCIQKSMQRAESEKKLALCKSPPANRSDQIYRLNKPAAKVQTKLGSVVKSATENRSAEAGSVVQAAEAQIAQRAAPTARQTAVAKAVSMAERDIRNVQTGLAYKSVPLEQKTKLSFTSKIELPR